ncbi:MAG: hypothetical protein SPL83_04660 [Succinivibrio sp.]|nr:hypothetical protein [Succinivibrio sp.]
MQRVFNAVLIPLCRIPEKLRIISDPDIPSILKQAATILDWDEIDILDYELIDLKGNVVQVKILCQHYIDINQKYNSWCCNRHLYAEEDWYKKDAPVQKTIYNNFIVLGCDSDENIRSLTTDERRAVMTEFFLPDIIHIVKPDGPIDSSEFTPTTIIEDKIINGKKTGVITYEMLPNIKILAEYLDRLDPVGDLARYYYLSMKKRRKSDFKKAKLITGINPSNILKSMNYLHYVSLGRYERTLVAAFIVGAVAIFFMDIAVLTGHDEFRELFKMIGIVYIILCVTVFPYCTNKIQKLRNKFFNKSIV